MASSGRLTRARRQRFLRVLAETANVSASAAAVNVPRGVVYRLRGQDQKFAALWDEALNSALDQLEEALMKRAIEGVDKPVFYGGKPLGTTKSYSDALAMFLLKSRRPEVYGEVAARRAQRDAAPLDDDPVAELARRLDGIAERVDD